jgi:dUTP pyrophosphatase
MIAVEEMTETEDRDVKTSVKFKLAPGAALPHYETEGSSGLDIRANEETVIQPGTWAMVGTGLFPEIDKGFEIQVRSRSGLAAKKGLFVLNSPGTVDSDYRGEIKVILANMSKAPFTVEKGERIAQIVVCPVIQAQVSAVEEISETRRGEGGFGSTGTK